MKDAYASLGKLDTGSLEPCAACTPVDQAVLHIPQPLDSLVCYLLTDRVKVNTNSAIMNAPTKPSSATKRLIVEDVVCGCPMSKATNDSKLNVTYFVAPSYGSDIPIVAYKIAKTPTTLIDATTGRSGRSP